MRPDPPTIQLSDQQPRRRSRREHPDGCRAVSLAAPKPRPVYLSIVVLVGLALKEPSVGVGQDPLAALGGVIFLVREPEALTAEHADGCC